MEVTSYCATAPRLVATQFGGCINGINVTLHVSLFHTPILPGRAQGRSLDHSTPVQTSHPTIPVTPSGSRAGPVPWRPQSEATSQREARNCAGWVGKALALSGGGILNAWTGDRTGSAAMDDVLLRTEIGSSTPHLQTSANSVVCLPCAEAV
jgi:hypothetical protein